MGNSTSNSTSLKQSIQNDFLTVNSNSCAAASQNEISGNVFNVGGDLTNAEVFTISGDVSASCAINQQTTQSVTNILDAQIEQTAKTANDWFNGFVIYSETENSAEVQQSITNNITNINTNTCNATTTNQISNNTLNVGGNADNVTAFSISSDANSTCVINNTVNQEAYNQQQASVDQEAVNMGMLVAIITAITTMMIVGLIVIAILFGFGVFGYPMISSKEETPPASAPDEGASTQTPAEGTSVQGAQGVPAQVPGVQAPAPAQTAPAPAPAQASQAQAAQGYY